jgi:hypothetical protein
MAAAGVGMIAPPTRGAMAAKKRSGARPHHPRAAQGPAPERMVVNFDRINRAALAALPTLLARWLPSGRREGPEYIALNPTRADRHLGSFRINTHTGRWGDFATGDRGGDVISLVAFLAGIGQQEAAVRLAEMLGVHRES